MTETRAANMIAPGAVLALVGAVFGLAVLVVVGALLFFAGLAIRGAFAAERKARQGDADVAGRHRTGTNN